MSRDRVSARTALLASGRDRSQSRRPSPEQVPGDGQDGSAGLDDRFLLAAPPCDPVAPLAREGTGAPSRDHGLAQDPREVTVAVPGRTLPSFPPASLTPRQTWPRTKSAPRSEAHVPRAPSPRQQGHPRSRRRTQPLHHHGAYTTWANTQIRVHLSSSDERVGEGLVDMEPCDRQI